MEQIVIYKRDGTIRYRLTSYAKLCTLKSAEQKHELLGEDTLTVKTNSTQPMELVVGDYIEIFGSKYTLNRINEPTKISERKFENSMVFEGLQYKLIDAQYRNTDAAGHNPSADFPIVANMRLLMQLLINNINRVASSLGEVWELGDCPETEHKEYTFSNENCLEVLQRVCKDNNIEFEIEAINTKRFKLHIRKVGKLFPATFTYGKGGGIYKLTRKNVNSNNLITRLYIEGGTRNITSKYRNGALRLRIGDNEESYIENATAKAAFGLKEGSRTYDDIYPHRTGTVTGLVAGQPLKFVDSEMFDLNEKDSEGQTKWLIADTAAKIKFVGNCNLSGYQFEIASYDTATKTFTLNLYEDSRGLKIPDGQAYTIEEGAEYVLLDIVMPNDPYVVDAEAELKATGEKDLEQDSQPKVEYELELSSLELKRRFGSEAGIVNLFAVGDYLPIKDPDINVAKAIRIKGFTRDCCSDPYKYKVTLSDTVEVSLIQQIIEDNAEIGRIIVLNDLTNVAKARANWRTTQELLGMVFDGDGYFDTSNIRPNSIETLMLSVGNRAGQFVLRNIFIEANAAVGGKPNPNVLRITSQGGHLIHYAIEETDRTWMMSGVELTLTTGAPLYIYAVCPKAGSAGSFVASATKFATDTGNNYYFPVGVLSSVFNGYREVTTTYGAARITGRCINCGRIESIDKSTYFDLDNGEIGGNIKFKSTDGTLKDVSTIEAGVAGANDAIDALSTQVGNNSSAIDGLTQQVGQQRTAIDGLYDNTELLSEGISQQGTTIEEMQAYINGQSQTIQELQELTGQLKEQVDGTIEYWYGTEDPSLDDEPASNWTDEDIRVSHLGDIYTNTTTGLEYRYSRRRGLSSIVNGQIVRPWIYYWQEIPSTGIGQAIQTANSAVSIANGKSHVYVTASANITPTADYKQGDLWIMLDTLKMKYCVGDSDGIGYKAADWADAGYTDDTAANNALSKLEDMADDGIITPVEKLQLQTYWRELAADYAVIITQAEAAGVSHSALTNSYNSLSTRISAILEDMESNSTINRTTFNALIDAYYSNRAKLLKAITDKKNTIHVTANPSTYPPVTYRRGDLWFTLNDYKVKLCIKSCANKTFAATDWKNAGYTDDTAANNALNQLNALADDGIITPSEKLSLQTEMSNINADFVATSGKATAMGVNTSTYEATFNALVAYVNPLLEDMESNSAVDRTTYNSKFAAYYSERTNILVAISQKYVDNLEIGQGNYIANGAYFAATKGWNWDADSQQLYADSVMGSVLRFGKSNTTKDFFLYTGLQSAGGNLMLPDNKFMAGRTYTLAFWVKASKAMSMLVGVMDPTGTKAVAPYTSFNIGTGWQRISYTFTATDKSQANTRLYIRGEHSVTFTYCLFTKFVLVEGTKAPEWTDSSREYLAQIQANKDTLKAITDNYTEINGGLILSTFLKLGAVLTSGIYQESAGLKAMLDNVNEIAAYFGGSYAEALAGKKDGMTVIYHNGKLKSKDAEITGVINATSGVFKDVLISGSIRNKFTLLDDSFNTDYNDNVAMYSTNGSFTTVFNLPWDASQIGRRIVITNFFWKGNVSYGTVEIPAPDGKYFFIDGIRKNSLKLDRQIVELIGFGSETDFYGWIVLNIQNAYCAYAYGSNFKCIATGTVTGLETGADIKAIAFDGTELTVMKIGKGIYRIKMPSTWFYNKDDYMVWLTGWGGSAGSLTKWCNASLLVKRNDSFDVGVSVGSSPEDNACFNFMINNIRDWNNWQ